MSEPGVQFERRCAFEDALLYGVQYKYYWSLIKVPGEIYDRWGAYYPEAAMCRILDLWLGSLSSKDERNYLEWREGYMSRDGRWHTNVPVYLFSVYPDEATWAECLKTL